MNAYYSEAEKADSSILLDGEQEEARGFLHHEATDITRKKQNSKTWLAHWVAHCFSVVVIGFLILGGAQANTAEQGQCWRLFNWWSPVDQAVIPFPFVSQRFNGSLWYKSPFKGPPTPEVEKAWDDAKKYGMIRISEEDISRLHELGQSPDVSLERSSRYPPELGGGYIATTIGSHQLHCLHSVWMDHHMRDFPEMQHNSNDRPELYDLHYEHCIDLIRQSLMCNFDTGIVTYNWVRDLDNPTPNANVPHKCVDWGALDSWLAERAIEVPAGYNWSQPADAYSLAHHPS